ncbi:MAG: ABC transporter substrate-binding protein [Bradyrhizobium sp.]|jgi:putative ABC transport system substrate-binding protein
MRRRDFIGVFGGAAAAMWPLRVVAQRSTKVPRVGVLLYNTVHGDPNSAPFHQGMRELGYVDGQNVTFEYRFAEGRPERLPGLAAEMARLTPDVIFALGGDVAPHAIKATKTIPIAFAVSTDPVRGGLVASLARPGGNATGVTFLQDELAAKRLGLLKEVAPKVSRLAFLYNPDHIDNERREAERAAAALGVQLHLCEVRGPGDLDAALDGAARASVEALYVVASRQTVTQIGRIVDFATINQLPLAGGWGTWAESGGLISYGPNVSEMVRQSAAFVDNILKGAKPAELPVQQPTRFELLINLKTARALGLAIPEPFLLAADTVIE